MERIPEMACTQTIKGPVCQNVWRTDNFFLGEPSGWHKMAHNSEQELCSTYIITYMSSKVGKIKLLLLYWVFTWINVFIGSILPVQWSSARVSSWDWEVEGSVPSWVRLKTVKMVPIDSLLGLSVQGWTGKSSDYWVQYRCWSPGPSGDDGSNVETKFTSFRVVTFRGLKLSQF